MRSWLRRNHAFAWALLAIVFLSGANLTKYEFVSLKWIKSNQTLIETTSTIITTILVLMAGLASYFRFFHGRLFNPKLGISATSGYIEMADSNLHWIDAEFENRGSTTLWDHKVKITAKFAQTDNDVKLHSLASAGRQGLYVIDPGEIAYEHGTVKVPKEIDFLTFHIEIKDAYGTTWDRCLTVPN